MCSKVAYCDWPESAASTRHSMGKESRFVIEPGVTECLSSFFSFSWYHQVIPHTSAPWNVPQRTCCSRSRFSSHPEYLTNLTIIGNLSLINENPLNDKSFTHLNLIKEFRNRAAHHFNIEWDESIIVLNQFCQFVEWYANAQA